ncbi:unnamed protein product [Toxocara canis]|nr:unnamed protein product [Toxocara canis]
MSAAVTVDDELKFRVHEEFSAGLSPQPVLYGEPPNIQLDKHILRLQELDLRKREPTLLRCCPLLTATVRDLRNVTRSSHLYTVYFEVHSPMMDAQRTLPNSMEADVCITRYAFASASGRPTKVLLKSSPLYSVQWRVITPMKLIPRRQLGIERVSTELMVSPAEALSVERWRMRWENVVLRISHGVNNAYNRHIMRPLQMPVELLTANIARAHRFNAIGALASVKSKRLVRTTVPQTIELRTLDQGERNSVRRVFVEREPEHEPISTIIHHHSSTLRR